MDSILSLLKDKNLKITPQRVAILKEIIKHGHIAVEEIFKNIKNDFPSISLATIYKNVKSLKDVEILYEIHTQDSKSKYEIKKSSHAHFICQICEELVDISINRDDFKNYGNFNKIDLYLYGICNKCKTTT